jgi:hypothetical protein
VIQSHVLRMVVQLRGRPYRPGPTGEEETTHASDDRVANPDGG